MTRYVAIVEFTPADGGEDEAVRTVVPTPAQASDRAWVYFTNQGRQVHGVRIETQADAEDSWGSLDHLTRI